MTQYNMLNHNLTVAYDTLKFLQTIESSTDVGSHLIFNCYYSAFSIVDPKTYSNLFTNNAIIFNLLYNLGFMYTDVS